jgi:cytochrome c-type biogenesis protein
VRRVVVAAFAFVLGFTTVFVAMGATASALSQLLIANAGWLAKIAGAVIVAFGLHFLGLFRLRFLDREARVHVERRPTGPLGAYAAGLAFAFGWTPCVGPVLATILTVAAGRDELWQGASLLSAYAFGIGVPFLFAAFFAGPFMRLMGRFRAQLGRVEQVMGVLLVVTGLLIIAGSFDELGYWLLRTFPALGRIG